MATIPDYNQLNATDDDTLTPFLYIGASKVKSSGKMKNNSSTNATLKCGESFTIPLGYHDGTGVIRVASLSDQTNNANVTSRKMLLGKTAWASGKLITGILPTISAAYELGVDVVRFEGGVLRCYINQGAYSNGSNDVFMTPATLATTLSVSADKIPAGQTLLGVAGTFDANGTVLPEDVLLGKTIYSNGKKIVGTLVLNSLY